MSGSPLPQQLLHVLAHLPAIQQPLQQHLVACVGREIPALEHGTEGRLRAGRATTPLPPPGKVSLQPPDPDLPAASPTPPLKGRGSASRRRTAGSCPRTRGVLNPPVIRAPNPGPQQVQQEMAVEGPPPGPGDDSLTGCPARLVAVTFPITLTSPWSKGANRGTGGRGCRQGRRCLELRLSGSNPRSPPQHHMASAASAPDVS